MRRCLIICALLTSACGDEPPEFVQPYIPADLLVPCLTPDMPSATEGQFARKVLRIAADRDCANQKIVTISDIVTPDNEKKGAGFGPL